MRVIHFNTDSRTSLISLVAPSMAWTSLPRYLKLLSPIARIVCP